MPFPLPKSTHSHGPQHKIQPDTGTAGPRQRVSEISEAEIEAFFPAIHLFIILWRGKGREVTFIHAYNVTIPSMQDKLPSRWALESCPFYRGANGGFEMVRSLLKASCM